jgi:hypothetical protein
MSPNIGVDWSVEETVGDTLLSSAGVNIKVNRGKIHFIWSSIDPFTESSILFYRGGKLNTTDIAQSTTAEPSKFSLSQNYPNPFNPTTRLQFSVTQYEWVVLKVYDVLGREVATLVNEQKVPGSYNVEWNADHFASGVYFYQMKVGSFSDVKKMLLIK